jgi:ferric-dicitrate binding protein FerR (iron transport regulator)
MKKKHKQKAEDRLAEKNIPTFAEDFEDFEDINDLYLESQLYSFLTSDQSVFPETEKDQLKNRIKTSVRKHNWKRRFIRISAAAAILVGCALTGIWYFQMNSSSEMIKYAQTIKSPVTDTDTRLILQDGKEVRIGNVESQISYAQNGEDITIGTDQKVFQNIISKKTNYNTVIVPYGKRTLITLSEGTKVWLNSGSKLIFPAVFSENKREVYIDGEAVFEVTHSETTPFYVQTRDFDIKVLGTVFNVSSYADDKNSSTVLQKGKIELSYKGNAIFTNEKFTILPGTMAVFNPDKNNFTKEKVNPQDYMSWHDGYLVFNNEKLINILKRLSRYYNVDILLTDAKIQNETFSGKLDLKSSPSKVLDIIAKTTPFIYEREDNQIVIKSH